MVAAEAVILTLRELVVIAVALAVVLWLAYRLRREDRRLREPGAGRPRRRRRGSGGRPSSRGSA